jgi:hypothetical protein
MKTGLYEVESFAPGTLARVGKGPFELNGDVYDLTRSGQYFVQLSQKTWRRIKPAATATEDSAPDPEGYDILVNVTSFMEMTDIQVEGYFRLIARSMRPGSLFVCVNRDGKSTRFAEYPWHLINGEILVDTEDLTSRFFHDGQVILRRIICRS